MKEHVVIVTTNLTSHHFCLYWNQSSMAEYTLSFNWMHSVILLADNAMESYFPRWS